MSLMVSISGIRGIVGVALTPDIIVKYASAFAEYVHRRPIVVGRDGRITGNSMTDIVVSTLLQMGCDVHDIGVCPTPTVSLAVERLRAAGGIAITASHNPIQWNGLKFIASTGLFLDAAENKSFWTIADRGSFEYVEWNKQGRLIEATEHVQKHIDAVLSLPFLDLPRIRNRKFKVVLDCVNAAGGLIVPILLRSLGCDVIEMNCNISGVFSHTPEPIPENLTALSQRVISENADVGIAVDPDVDRLVLMTERGEPFVEEYTVTAAVKYILQTEKAAGRIDHTVVVNLSTTRAVDDVAAEFGATVVRTPVGEINVASRMRALKSIIGGEGSGGVILPAVHYSRDAIVGIGIFLQYLTEFGGRTSGLKASLPQYTIVKNKIELGHIAPADVLRKLHEKYSRTERTNMDDGLKIDFATSWVHLRKSNTEPIIRIIAEARTKLEATTLVDSFTEEIEKTAGGR
ncbi:MAG: phosphoglucosamine mutase [Ignavibacteriales bacterium]|nr:phosphoglucosamine mutase [Ignavibacteriales bacterium]